MTHWLYRRAFKVSVLLLVPSLTGCVIHKASPPPVVAVAPAPEQPAAPLYIADLTQNAAPLPEMPEPPLPDAQPTPPPQSEFEIARSKRPAPPAHRARGHRGEIELAERETREREREKDKEQDAASANSAAASDANQTAAIAPAVDKVTAPTPAGDTSQTTPIGPLTASTTQDDASKHQAVDLIDTTQRGINSLHRALSGEQEKTVAQIRSFLNQAQRAMHNGDVDGAFTLATKAKVLLDELNGAT